MKVQGASKTYYIKWYAKIFNHCVIKYTLWLCAVITWFYYVYCEIKYMQTVVDSED